jgi:LPXTG-motif cell wall-anchored protein
MNSNIKQRAFTTLAATLLIGGVSIGSASAANAAEGDLSAFGDLGDIAQVDANVSLNNNNGSILDTTADVNVNLGDNQVIAPVAGIVNEAKANVNLNLTNPSQVSPSQPFVGTDANVYLGSPYVAQAVPVAPVSPVPAVVSAPAAEVSVALNAATNTADGILSNFTGDNQGGLTGSLVDGTANIRIGNLQPGQQYDFILYSDSDTQTEPTVLGTLTADATGFVVLALPAGLVNSGDGSGNGLLNADGDAVTDTTGIAAADSILRIAVLPGGAGVEGLTNGGSDVLGVLDGMVGWVDPVTGTPGDTPVGNDGNTGTDANNGGGAAAGGNNGNGSTGVLQNNGAVVPASSTLANMSTGTTAGMGAEAVQTRGFLDNLANTGAQKMGILLPIGGLLIAAGTALFFYRRKLGLSA